MLCPSLYNQDDGGEPPRQLSAFRESGALLRSVSSRGPMKRESFTPAGISTVGAGHRDSGGGGEDSSGEGGGGGGDVWVPQQLQDTSRPSKAEPLPARQDPPQSRHGTGADVGSSASSGENERAQQQQQQQWRESKREVTSLQVRIRVSGP